MMANELFRHRFLLNFTKYRFLLAELVKRDIKIKYRRSVIGIFWSFLNPLLTMMVLTIIFSTIFSMNIANFPVYFLTGLIMFELFAKGTNGAMISLRNNASIIKKVYIPKYMYSLSVCLSEFVNFSLALIVLFLVMIFTNTTFTFYIFTAFVPILLLLIFTIGVGLMLATITVFFRDIEHLYNVFLTLLMYGSAIFYPADIIPEGFRSLLYINPIFAYITLCRDSFLYGKSFDPYMLAFGAISAAVALVLGIILFYRYQDKFILYI